MPLKRACRKAGPHAFLQPMYSPLQPSPDKISLMPSKSAPRGLLKPVSSISPTAKLETDLQVIDALFVQAGLVRHRREKPAGVARRVRFQDALPEELSLPPAEPRVAPNGVEWLPVPKWDKTHWLWHGFSTRRGGVSRTYCADGAAGELNLGFTADDSRENVNRNRQLLAQAVTGIATTPLVTLRQVHSNIVLIAGASENDRPCKGDGLMTNEPGLLIGVQTADCIPVLVADKKRKVVAAFHAGWRGTVKRIVEMGIGRMRLEFGSRPEDLLAAIGPGIGPCCYAVGEEVLTEFESQFAYSSELFSEVYDTDPVRTKYPMLFLTQRAPGHSPIGPSLHVNLMEANRRQLLDAGLKPASIQIVGGCTSCQPAMFFSHRTSKGRSGRMLSVIGIRGRQRRSPLAEKGEPT
jgi:polyphenol oxidase